MRDSVAALRLPLARRGWALLAIAGLTGCTGSGAFVCSEAEQCAIGSVVGTCQPDGSCSFPDLTCPSGERYGEHAAPELAGSCVPAQGSTGTPQDASTTDGGAGTLDGSGTGPMSTSSPLTHDGGTSTTSTTPLDTSDGTTTSGSSGDATTSTTTAGSESGSPLVVLSYPATLAECNDPVNLDPDACELGSDPPMGALVVDLDDMGVGPIHAFLRFDFDDALVPADVVSVTLRMVATDLSDSPSSGEVYRVEPFELMDLYALQPATAGPVLAPDQGAVAQNDVVEWPLPPDLLSGGETSLYLGILPLSTNGTDYWNLDGAAPPELIIEQQP